MILAAYYPPFMVAILTFVPLLLFHFRVPGALGLALDVGSNHGLYYYAFYCVCSFYIAFIVSSNSLSSIKSFPHRKATSARNMARNLRFSIIVYTLLLVSLGTIATIGAMQYVDYTELLMAVIQNDSNVSLRLQLLSSEVPGIIRMMNYLIPSAIIILFGIVAAYERVKVTAGWFLCLFVFILLAQILRGLIWMDRNSLFMIAVIGLLCISTRVEFKRNYLYILGWLFSGVMIPILYVANVQATIRGGELLDTITIFNYADLGMANASLALTSTSNASLGMESLFTPLATVPRGIGMGNIAFPSMDSEWIHNPAANLLTYTIYDFGYFGFISYLVWGSVAGWIFNKRKTHRTSLVWNVAFLWLIYAVATIWTVPVSRGPDYWCGVLFSIVISWRLDRLSSFRHRRPRAHMITSKLPVTKSALPRNWLD